MSSDAGGESISGVYLGVSYVMAKLEEESSMRKAKNCPRMGASWSYT